MVAFKRLLFFYIINLLVYLLLSLLFGRQLLVLLQNMGFRLLAIPLLVIIPALIIGFIIMTFVNNNQKTNKIFITTYIICSSLFGLIILEKYFSSWKHERNFGNIESNEDYFKYFIKDNLDEKKISFDTLLTKFSNPNEIEIQGTMSKTKDSIITNSKNSIYFIRIMYKKNTSKGIYKADFTVYNHIAQMHYYDIPLTESDKKSIMISEQKIKKDIKDAIKVVENEIEKKKKQNE